VLIENVRIFNGVDEKLTDGHILIEGNLIKTVSSDSILVDRSKRGLVIDGGGRVLMPGLIDSHVHFNLMVEGGPAGLEAATWEEIGAVAAYAAREWLMCGFTTVRDMGGMSTGLRKIIDRGLFVGPRIYVCGAFISQTAGHADFRLESQSNPEEANGVKLGIYRLADGADAVTAAARANFAGGADYIKLMVAGGIASEKDPFFSLQYTPDEIRAAVEAAEAWDTYVAVHVYYADHIRRALDLGVMCIDHGHLIDEPTAVMLKEKGAFLSPNLANTTPHFLKHPTYGRPGSPQRAKLEQYQSMTQGFVPLLKKVKPKIVFNTDIAFTTGKGLRSHIDFEKWAHADRFGNFEALKALTSAGGELAALTGQNNPYPDGKVGVIEEGAYADLLIVDGNPLEDVTAIGGNPKWFDAEPRGESPEAIRLIMKDGVIYKNTL
jgi:imidazolonepropionase-like amidohydrolase